MAKIRINEITKELVSKGIDVDNKKVVAFLESQGITGKTHSSSIEEAEAELVKNHFESSAKGDAKKEEKPKTVPKPVKEAAQKPKAAAQPQGKANAAQPQGKPNPAQDIEIFMTDGGKPRPDWNKNTDVEVTFEDEKGYKTTMIVKVQEV